MTLCLFLYLEKHNPRGLSKVTNPMSGQEVDASRRPCATFGLTAFVSGNISMICVANLKIYLLGST